MNNNTNNNISLCEENCKLIDYNYFNEKAKCSCDIKTSMPPFEEIKFNKNDFFKSFIDVKNIFNMNILKCYKTVFKVKELKKNYGFFFVSFIVLLYFFSLIIFSASSFNKYKKEIKNIILSLKSNKSSSKKQQIIMDHVT